MVRIVYCEVYVDFAYTGNTSNYTRIVSKAWRLFSFAIFDLPLYLTPTKLLPPLTLKYLSHDIVLF
jgi:hypothetical protein